ncbi:MAG: hypothetical protein ACOYBM_05080 [Dethiobacteria bacterium]|nr:hypothetical protein [Bacillota bacterium]
MVFKQLITAAGVILASTMVVIGLLILPSPERGYLHQIFTWCWIIISSLVAVAFLLRYFKYERDKRTMERDKLQRRMRG